MAGRRNADAVQPDGGNVTTLDTWCPLCGDVTAELHDGAFQCPDCKLTIPRRIVESGPTKRDLERRADARESSA